MFRLIAFTLLISACYAQTQFPIKAVSLLNGVVMSPEAEQAIQRMMRNPGMQSGGMPQGITFIIGEVHFFQEAINSPVQARVNITLSPPVQGKVVRGLHVHQFGISSRSENINEVCATAGGHYNPHATVHGSLTSVPRHVGDFGNVVQSNGIIFTDLTIQGMTLVGADSIVGRSIVLHGNADDLGLGKTPASALNGNAGPRIACGSIVYQI